MVPNTEYPHQNTRTHTTIIIPCSSRKGFKLQNIFINGTLAAQIASTGESFIQWRGLGMDRAGEDMVPGQTDNCNSLVWALEVIKARDEGSSSSCGGRVV